jgi:hypothetical protein
MERVMSEMETRIDEWRCSLDIALGDADEIIDELESHLRDEIDRLMKTGHTPESALAAAQAKLGQPKDLAAEYARSARPAVWLPISVGLPLLVLSFGFIIWRSVVPAIAESYVVLGLSVAMFAASHAVTFYMGLLGLCYVLCRLIQPMSLGQCQSLRRSLIVANAGAAVLLLIGLGLTGIWMHYPGHAWSRDYNWGRVIVSSFVLLWFIVLTGVIWTNPKRLHVWVLLSVVTISVNFWSAIAPRVFLDLLSGQGLPPRLLWMTIAYTVVPLSIAFLGLLPARQRLHRPA